MRTFRSTCALLAISATSLLAADPKPSAPDVKVEAMLKAIKVLPDKAPDCSTLKSIAESVTRGCKTNDEKAIAIYNFMHAVALSPPVS